MTEQQVIDTGKIIIDFRERGIDVVNHSIPIEASVAWIGMVATFASPLRMVVEGGETVVAHDVYPSIS